MQELKDLLECPICMSVPRSGPITQCKNGHVVCSSCLKQLERCPSCRETIDIRVLQLEKMLQVMPHQCMFAENGCNVEMRSSRVSIIQIFIRIFFWENYSLLTACYAYTPRFHGIFFPRNKFQKKFSGKKIFMEKNSKNSNKYMPKKCLRKFFGGV
jgi:hypothetical protein